MSNKMCNECSSQYGLAGCLTGGAGSLGWSLGSPRWWQFIGVDIWALQVVAVHWE